VIIFRELGSKCNLSDVVIRSCCNPTNRHTENLENRNSVLRSFNVGYDHGDYRERVESDKEFLEKLDLNAMYKDTSLTGFDWFNTCFWG
jgi:hypothetical protein